MTGPAAPAAPLAAPQVPGPALAALASMPRVNLMPPEIAARAALRRLQLTCASALVLAVAAVGGLYYQAHSQVGSARTQLADAQSRQQVTQRQLAALAPVAATYRQVQSAQRLLAQALGGEVRWSTQLRDLSLSIPADVWLTNMTVTRSTAPAAGTPGASSGPAEIATIRYTGVASDRDDVADWLDSLAREKGYVDAYYSTSPETVLGLKTFVNFSSTVQVTADALSGRYSSGS